MLSCAVSFISDERDPVTGVCTRNHSRHRSRIQIQPLLTQIMTKKPRFLHTIFITDKNTIFICITFIKICGFDAYFVLMCLGDDPRVNLIDTKLGTQPSAGDFHTQMKLGSCIFQSIDDKKSAGEEGTFRNAQVAINRNNSIRKKWSAAYDAIRRMVQEGDE